MITEKKRGCVTITLLVVLLAALLGYGMHLVSVAENNSRGLALMKEICAGMTQYAEDHHGRLPRLSDPARLPQQLAPYGAEISLREQPALLVRPGTNISYLTNPALSGKKISSLPASEKMVVLYQAVPTNGQRIVAVLFQGTFQPLLVSESKWQRLTGHAKILNLDAATREQLQ